MSEPLAGTSGRLLSLLSLLQTPREWPGPELAERLDVTTRTVRNDGPGPLAVTDRPWVLPSRARAYLCWPAKRHAFPDAPRRITL